MFRITEFNITNSVPLQTVYKNEIRFVSVSHRLLFAQNIKTIFFQGGLVFRITEFNIKNSVPLKTVYKNEIRIVSVSHRLLFAQNKKNIFSTGLLEKIFYIFISFLS